eukprot:6202199-Pleurochrysis_carterae.AAC.2
MIVYNNNSELHTLRPAKRTPGNRVRATLRTWMLRYQSLERTYARSEPTAVLARPVAASVAQVLDSCCPV